MKNKPTALDMAKSLGGTALDTIVHTVKTGRPLSSIDVQEERINTCKTCELFIAHRRQCKKCKCNLTPKIKLSAAKCPLDKWIN